MQVILVLAAIYLAAWKGILQAYWSAGEANIGSILIGLIALAFAQRMHVMGGTAEEAPDRLADSSLAIAVIGPLVLGIGFAFDIVANWAAIEANAIDWNIWIGQAMSGSYGDFRDEYPGFSGFVALTTAFFLPALWRIVLAYGLTQAYLLMLHVTLFNGISDHKFFAAKGTSVGMGSALAGFLLTVLVVLLIYL